VKGAETQEKRDISNMSNFIKKRGFLLLTVKKVPNPTEKAPLSS